MAEAVALGTTAGAAAAAALGTSAAAAAGATAAAFDFAAVPPPVVGPGGGGWTKQVTCRYALSATRGRGSGGGRPSPNPRPFPSAPRRSLPPTVTYARPQRPLPFPPALPRPARPAPRGSPAANCAAGRAGPRRALRRLRAETGRGGGGGTCGGCSEAAVAAAPSWPEVPAAVEHASGLACRSRAGGRVPFFCHCLMGGCSPRLSRAHGVWLPSPCHAGRVGTVAGSLRVAVDRYLLCENRPAVIGVKETVERKSRNRVPESTIKQEVQIDSSSCPFE